MRVGCSTQRCLLRASGFPCAPGRPVRRIHANLRALQQQRSWIQTSFHRCRQASLMVSMALEQQQTTQSQSASVAIITTLGCQYCKQAKEALHKAGVAYEEIEAGSQLDLLQTIKKSTGKSTVPQVPFQRSLCSAASTHNYVQLFTNAQCTSCTDICWGKVAGRL